MVKMEAAMKKGVVAMIALGMITAALACGPKKAAGKTTPVKRPCWSKAQTKKAIIELAQEYRNDPAGFWGNRTYVWAGTWLWPETVGINSRHIKLLKKMFYEGDEATREIVLNVILMNVPAKKLARSKGEFLKDLVLMDTELKESRANVPPPSHHEEIIEEYLPR